MNRMIQSAFAAALMLLVSSAMADSKIAYVQADRVLQNVPQTVEATKKLEKEFSPRTTDLSRLQKQLEAQQTALEKDALTLTEADRNKRSRDINDLKVEYERKQRELSEDFNIRKNEELGLLQDKINKAISTVAEAAGYDVVLLTGVAYASKQMDITDSVLKAMSKQ